MSYYNVTFLNVGDIEMSEFLYNAVFLDICDIEKSVFLHCDLRKDMSHWNEETHF